MTPTKRVAILYPGNLEARQNATADNNRFTEMFKALAALGLAVEPAVYHDDFCEDVRGQLLRVDGVLVWYNPIEGGRDRRMLDAMLRDVAAAGVFVTTHPDTILKMGTKEVLYQSRHMSWGCDTKMYHSPVELRNALPLSLAKGRARVLKQLRGHSGIGVWRVEQVGDMLRVKHAQRGSVDEVITLAEFVERCEPYFAATGKMIDQEFQERLPDGMIRCYLVKGKVAGFGHQEHNALLPDTPPGPRLYYPPTKPEFQDLKDKLENEWMPELQQLLDITEEDLPMLWDGDFLFGPKDENGRDTYVLCEINVSSVYPYPESATPHIARAMAVRLGVN